MKPTRQRAVTGGRPRREAPETAGPNPARRRRPPEPAGRSPGGRGAGERSAGRHSAGERSAGGGRVEALRGWLSLNGQAPEIVPPERHPIRPEQIHPIVAEAVERLNASGHLALIVGGAVRDLLLGRTPKDFDVATTARPEQVLHLFPQARLIGRRFRLVLLEYPGVTIEVSTFRAEPRRTARGLIERDNVFGHPQEDAFRRDFTINALALDLPTFSVIDFVGGLPDLEQGLLRTIAPAEVSFREDPVRMLRAVRFKLRLGFDLDPARERALHRLGPELERVSRHRLAEEMQRFLCAGQAQAAFRDFAAFGLLAPLLAMERHGWFFSRQALREPVIVLQPYLAALDAWVAEGREPIAPTVALLGLLVTLGRDELRGWLQGRAPDDPRQVETLRLIRSRLGGMLSQWGLLNGQVQPAMAIFNAAGLLLGREGDGRRKARRPPPGTREASILLALLRPVLGLDAAFTAALCARLPELAPLRILDHAVAETRPSPQTAGGGQRRRHPAGVRPVRGAPFDRRRRSRIRERRG